MKMETDQTSQTQTRRRGKGLTSREREFLTSYLGQRQTGPFTKEEIRPLSSRLKEIDGIERSFGAIYMHLRHLSGPKKTGEIKEPSEPSRILSEKFERHLQALKKCFECQIKRLASEDGKRVKKLEEELNRTRVELKEAHAELKRLTKLRQAVEDIQQREGRNHRVIV